MFSKRVADLGAPETSEILKELLPTTKKSRSGDAGEILATEIAEDKLHYQVPIRRLRWKDGREAALRGDDIVGVAHDSEGKNPILERRVQEQGCTNPQYHKRGERGAGWGYGPAKLVTPCSSLRVDFVNWARTIWPPSWRRLFSRELWRPRILNIFCFVISGNNPNDISCREACSGNR